jgi:hypothetical protein
MIITSTAVGVPADVEQVNWQVADDEDNNDNNEHLNNIATSSEMLLLRPASAISRVTQATLGAGYRFLRHHCKKCSVHTTELHGNIRKGLTTRQSTSL